MAALVQPEGDYEILIESYVKSVSNQKEGTNRRDRKETKTGSEQKTENQKKSK